METIDLNGTWSLEHVGGDERLPAVVPGCVHSDLLDNGKIEDPFFADNEARQMWIGESDWRYTRSFEVPASVLEERNSVELVCDGLDTFAAVSINGRKLADTDNQFRTYRFDVRSLLRQGENEIEILFTSPLPYMEQRQKKRFLAMTGIGHHRLSGSNYVRKSQCNFGWDWGPECVTAGIWRPVRIEAYREGRIEDVEVRQTHARKKVDLAVSVHAVQERQLSARLSLRLRGEEIDSRNMPVKDGLASANVSIAEPELWWPNGLGDQPLYELSVELIGQHGEPIDTLKKRIGLRTLELDRHEDKWGESFQFVCNGVPFFAKGANWIPADTFVTRITPEQYRLLLESARDAHMNMIRVWGGGIYEDDEFYDLCDELGLCVWQDFMFACSAYPAFDGDFMENVRIEAEQNVRRLRNHPSLALWCGNNEIEQIPGLIANSDEERAAGGMDWEEYKALFDELLAGIVSRLDPDRAYWPSSAHSPRGDRLDSQNPSWGDAHLWKVWHGRAPFEWYRSCEHRFNSEFGFQSFCEPAVVAGYTRPEDRNITSYIMEWHQRSKIGNDAIIQQMLSWFRLPTSHEMVLWASQILGGLAIKYAVEHWRRSRPRGMGTLYWQLNDCWPVASWSSIDFFGNWKALQYMARDFFAPVLLSVLDDAKACSAEIHVTSDLREPRQGKINWTLQTVDADIVSEGSFEIKIPAGANKKIELLRFKEQADQLGARNLLLFARLYIEDELVSRNFASFARPKHLSLQEPGIQTKVSAVANGAFDLELVAKKPALWAWPDVDGVSCTYSDRFFHLEPGVTERIRIVPEFSMEQREFEERLRVRTIRDTYA
jgi:beta-mannosidase